jgi:hypothetical protein
MRLLRVGDRGVPAALDESDQALGDPRGGDAVELGSGRRPWIGQG